MEQLNSGANPRCPLQSTVQVIDLFRAPFVQPSGLIRKFLQLNPATNPATFGRLKPNVGLGENLQKMNKYNPN